MKTIPRLPARDASAVKPPVGGMPCTRSAQPLPRGQRHLSAREVQVLELIALGLTNARIGNRLGITALTVKSHKAHIAKALGACGESSHSVAIGYARGYLNRLPAPPSTLTNLAKREYQVLMGLAGGLTNGEIGRYLGLAEDTIKTHARRLFNKLGARGRCHAVLIGCQTGLLRPAARTARPTS